MVKIAGFLVKRRPSIRIVDHTATKLTGRKDASNANRAADLRDLPARHLSFQRQGRRARQMVTSSQPQQVRVELVCAGGEPPLRAYAVLTGFSSRRCRLKTDEELPPLPPDTGLMLRLEDREAMEIVGLVERQEGREIDRGRHSGQSSREKVLSARRRRHRHAMEAAR